MNGNIFVPFRFYTPLTYLILGVAFVLIAGACKDNPPPPASRDESLTAYCDVREKHFGSPQKGCTKLRVYGDQRELLVSCYAKNLELFADVKTAFIDGDSECRDLTKKNTDPWDEGR